MKIGAISHKGAVLAASLTCLLISLVAWNSWTSWTLPYYEGKSLEDWLKNAPITPELRHSSSGGTYYSRSLLDPETVTALKAMGTNCVPFLIKKALAPSSPSMTRIARSLNKLPIPQLHRILPLRREFWRERVVASLRVLPSLTPEARAQLETVKQSKDARVRQAAYMVLNKPEPSIYSMLTALRTNGDPAASARFLAKQWETPDTYCFEIATEAVRQLGIEAFPILRLLQTNENEQVANQATRTLAGLSQSPLSKSK